jgi:DNA-binding response OmpR family regulator
MTQEEIPPVLTKDEVNQFLEPQSAHEDMDRIKILIAEDDHTTRLLYDKGLFDQVFDKKMIISGKEAIHVYNEWHPDIIVLDIYLPEMTGYQVLKEIRTTIQDKKTTIVMATSLSGSEDVLSCMKLGVEGYIVKPFPLREIWSKILGYYAKKEPERARKADALCREILKQAQVRWLLENKNKDKAKTKDATEGAGDGTACAQGGEAGGEKEMAETPAKEPKE